MNYGMRIVTNIYYARKLLDHEQISQLMDQGSAVVDRSLDDEEGDPDLIITWEPEGLLAFNVFMEIAGQLAAANRLQDFGAWVDDGPVHSGLFIHQGQPMANVLLDRQQVEDGAQQTLNQIERLLKDHQHGNG